MSCVRRLYAMKCTSASVYKHIFIHVAIFTLFVWLDLERSPQNWISIMQIMIDIVPPSTRHLPFFESPNTSLLSTVFLSLVFLLLCLSVPTPLVPVGVEYESVLDGALTRDTITPTCVAVVPHWMPYDPPPPPAPSSLMEILISSR